MERQNGHCMSLWLWLLTLITNPGCSVVVSVMTEENMYSAKPATLCSETQGKFLWIVLHWVVQQSRPAPSHQNSLHVLGRGSHFVTVAQLVRTHLILTLTGNCCHRDRSPKRKSESWAFADSGEKNSRTETEPSTASRLPLCQSQELLRSSAFLLTLLYTLSPHS